ncbi:hypothetical protein HYX10_03970 [Candidatus Woesearchaeota archaeon]|nr:hypothetical protein [Candidatus Woesearchaeota archaeon]
MNKFFYLCLLSIVVLSYSVFAQDLVAYDDSLINGFTFNEWQNPAGTPCLVSQSYSAESASGTASLASNLNAWCTLFVYRSSAFKIDDYSYVEFDVFGFQPAGQAFTLSLVPNGWSFLGSGKAIGDYAAVAGYWQHVSIPLSDFGVAAGTSIAGISFRGSGGTYGNVLFDNIKFTKVASPAAPVISNGSPAGVLPNTTAEAPMNVTTDKDAVCKYDSSSGVSYALMSDTFDVTGGLLHQATLTNLTPGQQYIRYVKCQDLSGNANTQDYLVSFAVASSGSPLPTGTYRPLFIGNSFIGQTNNHLMSQDIAVAAGLDWVSTGDFTGYSNLKTMWDKASVQEKLAAGGYSHVIFEPFWWGEGITYENETVYAQKFVDAAVAMGAEPIMFSTHHANGWAESNWPAQDAIDAQYAQMAQAVGGIRIMPEADIWQEAYSRGYSGTFYGGSGHQNNAGGYITSLGFVRLLSGLDVVGNTAPPRNTPPASDVPSAADILLFQQVVNDMVPDMLVDVYPPLVSTHSPAKDSADVAADSNISVRISDFGVGVDSSTIEMSVNGNPVTPAVEGTPADYLVSYDPPSNLPRSSLITVEVAAQDLNGIAAQGNFSFNTVEGCLLTSAYWSSAALSAGGVVALTAEGNNCGGETVSFHVAEDDAGEGSSVAEPISVQPSDADFGSSAVSSWTAEYHPDNSGADDPPEYYFTAALLSEPGVAVNSTLLRVYNGSVPDGVPPAVLSTAPSGNLPSGTTQATLAATTDEVSECRHAASAGTGFNLMSLFSSTGSTSHSTLITGLIDGAAYAYYVKCRDLAGNVNADSLISFAVLSPNPIAIDLQVSASKDDAYHSPGGWPNYADNTNNIRAGRPSSTPVWGGWRWTGLNIPPGSVITDAYVEFNQLEWGYSSIPTTLAFENSSNAVTFSSGNSPAHRWSKRTAFQTQWNWSRQTPGSWIRTPSLAAGIQELAANGINDLVLLEDGTPSLPSQSHEWASYDYNPSLAARLHIEYISTGMPPVISNGQPAGSFPAGTSEVTVSANTNEIATCKYDNIGSTDYGLMANTFSATGNLSHSTQLNGLSQGTPTRGPAMTATRRWPPGSTSSTSSSAQTRLLPFAATASHPARCLQALLRRA